MASTSKRTPAKGKGRGKGQGPKGCACKRSQCIKNYCDCYQSMMVCTQFCRCLGCRNTEERVVVESRTPSRNTSASRKDRAAALNAKAAAAAAKELRNNRVPLVSGTFVPPVLPVQVPPPTAIAPINMARMASESLNDVLQQIETEPFMPTGETDEVPIAPYDGQHLQFPEAMEPPATGSNGRPNLFSPIINEALLMCSLIQGCEAEELGLDHSQVSSLAIDEFASRFKDVFDAMNEHFDE